MWKLADLLTPTQRKQLTGRRPGTGALIKHPPRKRWVDCPTGKAPFATRAEALARCRQFLDDNAKTYRCAFCMHIHVGHGRR